MLCFREGDDPEQIAMTGGFHMQGLEAEVGKIGRGGLLGFAVSATSCEVFGEVLAKSASIACANHAKDGGDLASGFAFADHREGNFCCANLSGFLRRAKEGVVERLARLRQRKEQG